MKKIFVAVLAMAGVVACNTVDTLDVPQNPEIRFANAFVENATRANEALDPSTTTESLTAFDVWGFMEDVTGTVFVGEDVTGSNGNFTYTNTQYWVPGHTYYFAAVAPMNSTNVEVDTATADLTGLGTIKFTNKNGTEDLLYSAVAVDAPAFGEAKTVMLTFNHLLSKVKFTFTNGFANDNAKIVVTNIHIADAPKTATVTLTGNWWEANPWKDYEGTTDLAFGDAGEILRGAKQQSYDERLTIPAGAEQKYTVTFEVALYMGDVVAYSGTKTATIEGVALEIGKAYNFTATLNASNITKDGTELQPIVFDVEEVKDWEEAGAQTGVISGAVKDMTLLADAEATKTVNLTGVLDGAGHTISAVAGVDYVISNTARLIEAAAGSTVQNVKIDGKNNVYNGFGIRGIYTIGTGDVTVKNVEILNCTYAINANNAGKITVLNSTLQGWNSYGGTTEAYFENVKFIDGTYHNFRPYNNTVCKNCDFGKNVVIDLSCMVDGATIKFDNCTYDSAALTVADLNLPAGFVASVEGNVIFVEQAVVATTAEEFAAAVKANDKQINIVLNNDLDVAISSLGTITGGSGEYKLGGVDTEAITIDLNGKKLKITTTYWSNLGAKNDNAVFTIKNGTMTSSQASGTWNSYDLCFANCNYNFEDVVFEKAIALEGKAYNLKNVTIKESHDYYAMWITAKGQNVTIDGLTIESAGRGIKIDEQYQNSVAKVTLNVNNATFKTAKKAAIVVKSVEGAEINWGAGNSIAEVAADTNFAVWVDEDSAAVADKVVVNGALVKVEGSADVVVATPDELSSAINNGAKSVYLADGTYTLAKYPAGIELIGCGNDVVLNVQGKKYGVHGDVTIENVKVVYSNDNYTGFQHTNVETYKNCTIVGQPFLYGSKVTFEGCTFEQTSANAYNVWTYGAKAVEFVNCTFNSAGKSVLIYTESGNGSTVLFDGCQLNASTPVDGKAAIEIDSSLISGSFAVTINNTTATGFANGNVSGNSLWNNKKGNKTTITVDGMKVL